MNRYLSKNLLAVGLLSLLMVFVFSTKTDAAEPSFEVDFSSQEESQISSQSTQAPKVLPNLPSQDNNNTVTTNRILVKSIALADNTILQPAEIEKLTAPYLNTILTAENLQSIRQQLTLAYINKGYLSSGVILPEQIVENGHVEFQAIEGSLTSIEVDLENSILDGFAEREIRREVKGPLSLNDLETGIRKLELDPLIRRVSGRLLPGSNPGESRLSLDIEENHPLRISAVFDNFESPTVGANRGSIRLEHMNLTGHRDTLALSLSATDGLRDAFASYSFPFAQERLELSAYFGLGSSDVIESPFDELDIEGDNKAGGLSLGYKVANRLNRQVTLSTGLQYSSSETELLDESFSFARGARSGRSTSTSAKLELQWVERWGSQLLALRGSIRWGFDALNSTIIPSDAPDREIFLTGARIPESRFTVFLTQLQWAKRLNYVDSEIVVNAAWQRTPDALLSVDKFAIGGNATVRGFRENSLLRDNGFYTNFEWRVPVLRKGRWSRLNLVATPFFDWAQAEDQGDRLETSSASTLSSIGLSLTARPTDRWFMQLTYAERLRSESVVPARDRGLQDDGIHFAVSYQWSPSN